MALPVTSETADIEADKISELSDIEHRLSEIRLVVLDHQREDRNPLELPPRLELEVLPDLFIESSRLLDLFGFDPTFLKTLILRAEKPESFISASQQIGRASEHVARYISTSNGKSPDPSKIISETVPLLCGVGQWLADGFGMDMSDGTAVRWRRQERGLLDDSGLSV